jgi:hypothetical protein
VNREVRLGLQPAAGYVHEAANFIIGDSGEAFLLLASMMKFLSLPLALANGFKVNQGIRLQPNSTRAICAKAFCSCIDYSAQTCRDEIMIFFGRLFCYSFSNSFLLAVVK